MTCLVEMAADGMSKMDEKRVDASIGHVSQDDGLMFPERQVNSKLFLMSEEQQPAVDVRENR